MSLFAKITRPVLALVMVVGLGAGVAAAADYCEPCVQPDYCTPACTVQPAPALQPVCTTYCGENPSLAAIAPTNLPGYYVRETSYSVSSQRDTGISYLIPTMNGFIESDHIPLTNPVDQYYATHEVRNGQVVQTGYVTDTGALASIN